MVNPSILIVTNERNVAHDLREHLIKLGYRVVGIVTSDEEIIAKIEETKPDLILTDIRLNGEREGIKTGQLIHSNYDTPIIYITGSVGERTIQRAKSTGPFGYLFKPFDEKQIYATVETALLRHHLESELREGRQWLNAVLDGISDGVIAMDNHGAIRFINPIAKQLTGWSEIETIGKTLYEVFALIDESSHERVEVLSVKKSLNQKNEDTRFDGLLLSKYGKTTPVEADITVIQDGKGMAAGIVLVFRDITKRREAMQEIQRQTQRAEALVETAARLNAQLELTSVLDTICNISNQALAASATAVFLQDTREDVFNIMATNTQLTDLAKYEGVRFKIPGSVFESILPKENPVTFINDIQSYPNPPYLELLREQNIHTIGIAGLYSRHDLIGALILIYIGDPIHLPEDVRALLKALADQAGISITNASLFEQVRSGREFQKALSTRLVEIQETERRHIARDLHDQIGQVLTGLQFMLESSKNQDSEAHANKISEAQETVSGLIEQIREMSLNLRPAMLDDIGLLPTLLWHFERYTKQTGIKVSYNYNGITQRLLPDVETAVYRIVQEALTNTARYAQVTEAFIQLTLRENILGVEIIDHGIGFDSSVDVSKWSTAGLVGMRERANMLGGYLVVKSDPNKGTQILVMIPLDRKPVERRNRVRNYSSG
jgi:PAS domain S-box-containing protein